MHAKVQQVQYIALCEQKTPTVPAMWSWRAATGDLGLRHCARWVDPKRCHAKRWPIVDWARYAPLKENQPRYLPPPRRHA